MNDKRRPDPPDRERRQTPEVEATTSIFSRAEYKGGNIISYPILAIAIYLLAHGVFLSGLLFAIGGLAIMPRVSRYLVDVPSVLGWGLVALAFVTLP